MLIYAGQQATASSTYIIEYMPKQTKKIAYN